MDFSTVKDMLQKDTITAGYGIATSSIRRAASKVLKNKGVGAAGINALSIVAGMGLSQVSNPHVKIIGSALRISGIASFGNMIVERLVSSKTDEE